jgi:hypothetical protein
MKFQFCGKVLLYAVVLLTGASLDFVFGSGKTFLLSLTGYLALSEALSVLENLHEAEVRAASLIVNFIKSKLGGIR